jgi:DNA replication protein DnaC
VCFLEDCAGLLQSGGALTLAVPDKRYSFDRFRERTAIGRVIDTLLRNDVVLVDELGFAPLDDTGAQLLFRFVAAAYERRSLGIGSHWPFESWGRFLPEHTTAVSMLDRLLHHCHTVVTDGDSYQMKQARANGGTRLKTT